jgi:chemotaxis protein MotB
VLEKVAVALKDIPDKQIWVQGHTDDQPIFIAPKKAEKPDPKAKGKPKAPEKPEKLIEPLRFQTNWELSAARALEVVHYLQDTAKIDPARLAALAFGQYRPISRKEKALNRRIEIVLVPKKEVLQKVQPPPAPPAPEKAPDKKP